jgi:cobalt-zinc-cadmium efflux system outer membrane protein
MHAFRLRALMAIAVLSVPCLATAGETATLKTLFDQAWQRSPAARSQAARIEEANAIGAQARSWLAEAPVLGLSQRSDRWNDGKGQRETETSLSAAIHLPGQVGARRAFADRHAEEVAAHLAKAKLDLAGELRARIWDLGAAEAVLEERASHVKHTGELADEVARRVAAGDLARSDGLLAQQELATARILAAQAGVAVRNAALRLEQLSGAKQKPAFVAEPLAAQPVEPDPRLAAARAEENKAGAALAMARAARLPSPTFSIALRQEREFRLATPERSVGFGLQIPLGSAGRNQVAEAEARVRQDSATADREQAEAAILAGREAAGAKLAEVRDALKAAEDRAAAMREYAQLIDKAFKLGERGVADRIRAHTLAHEAEIGLRQQQVALGRAHAEHNQAAGVLP